MRHFKASVLLKASSAGAKRKCDGRGDRSASIDISLNGRPWVWLEGERGSEVRDCRQLSYLCLKAIDAPSKKSADEIAFKFNHRHTVTTPTRRFSIGLQRAGGHHAY